MKIKSIIVLFCLSLLTSCVSIDKIQAGDLESETYKLESFNQIEVSQGIEVIIFPSDQNKAIVESNVIEYLKLDITDDQKLHVHYDFPRNSTAKNSDTKVTLYAKDINSFEANSRGNIVVKDKFGSVSQILMVSSSGSIDYDVIAKTLNIIGSSSGKIVSEIEVDDLTIDSSSSSYIKLSGNANSADISASSSSDINAYELNVNNATIDASSNSNIEITVSKSINGKASSSGSIYYKSVGSVSENITTGSSGRVRQK